MEATTLNLLGDESISNNLPPSSNSLLAQPLQASQSTNHGQTLSLAPNLSIIMPTNEEPSQNPYQSTNDTNQYGPPSDSMTSSNIVIVKGEEHSIAKINSNDSDTMLASASLDGDSPNDTTIEAQVMSENQQNNTANPSDQINSMNVSTPSIQDDGSKSSKKRSKAVKRSAKLDAKSKLEKSRQSARECRARKKLRYQYLEDLVCNREKAVVKLREELSLFCEISKRIDLGTISDKEKILLMDPIKENSSS